MKTLINIAGDELDAVWGQQAQQTTILNVDNQQYPRTIILSTQGVRVARLGVAVGFSVSALIQAAIQLEPTLSWPPKITRQPVSGTTNTAGPASPNIAVNSELAVTYQWQVSTDSGTTWSNLANAGVYSNVTAATMNISSSLGFNGYQYRCIASNGSGSTISNAMTLTVDPDVTSGPANVSVAAPTATSFTVVTFGLTSVSYQWQLSTDGGSTWNDQTDTGVYTGSTTATLAISNSTGLNGNKYRCTVTDTGGTIHSSAATLTVT